MTDYLLKFLLCSVLLYSFYHFVLRDDRSFKFNRYFLLSILIISLIIPVTIVRTTVIEVPDLGSSLTESVIPLNSESSVTSSSITSLSKEQLITGFYLIVSSFIFLRLIFHLVSITRFRLGGQTVHKDGAKIVLRQDINHSFSFLDFIFTNKEAYEAGNLPQEIIEHEKAHVDQKHSHDILFMEILTCLFWFNPVLYMVKRAVKLNHEFLADASVIAQTGTPDKYQRIIISALKEQSMLKPILTSHLNYGETKKRLNIMAKQHKKGVSLIRQTGSIAVIITLFLWLGAEQVIAQQLAQAEAAQTEAAQSSNAQIAQDRPPPPPPVMVRLSANAKVRFQNESNQTITGTFNKLSDEQKERFLSGKSKAEIMVPPPPRAHLTQAMLEDFQNKEKYGLWIDGARKENAVLKNFELKDFHHFFKTRVHKGAKHFSQYEFHLEMITTGHMEASLKERWIPFRKEFIPKPGEKEYALTVVRQKN